MATAGNSRPPNGDDNMDVDEISPETQAEWDHGFPEVKAYILNGKMKHVEKVMREMAQEFTQAADKIHSSIVAEAKEIGISQVATHEDLVNSLSCTFAQWMTYVNEHEDEVPQPITYKEWHDCCESREHFEDSIEAVQVRKIAFLKSTDEMEKRDEETAKLLKKEVMTQLRLMQETIKKRYEKQAIKDLEMFCRLLCLKTPLEIAREKAAKRRRK